MPRRPHGQIIAFNNRTYDVTKAVPTVVMRNEDYGRIARILADGTPVTLEATIANKTYPEGRTSYNAIAEIAGTDKKDEVVMLGGHLDSWHSATGATDNAIGCAIMMEAARILKTIGVQPRRTIRVALWSGEEEGLLGSLAYVKEHFGIGREPEAGVRQVRRLSEHRLRHRPRARRVGLRSAGGRRDSARDRRAVQGSRASSARSATTSRARRRHRQHVVQQRRAAGHRLRPGLDRIRQSTRITPTSTPTSASSKRTSRRRDRRSRRRSISWRCATRCCRVSRRRDAAAPPQRTGRH